MSDSSAQPQNVNDILGLHPSSPILRDYVASLSSLAGRTDVTKPEVKPYSDAVYFNYYPLGISLLFSPKNGYKPKVGEELKDENLVLDSIDVYNIPKPQASKVKGTSSRTAELAFNTFPQSPLPLTLTAEIKDKDGNLVPRPLKLDLLPDTSGKDFVKILGEPDRKGGGSGPSSGSIGIWCEWSKDGIMVEFGGDEAKGPQAWERGKDAIWKVVTIFSPSSKDA